MHWWLKWWLDCLSVTIIGYFGKKSQKLMGKRIMPYIFHQRNLKNETANLFNFLSIFSLVFRSSHHCIVCFLSIIFPLIMGFTLDMSGNTCIMIAKLLLNLSNFAESWLWVLIRFWFVAPGTYMSMKWHLFVNFSPSKWIIKWIMTVDECMEIRVGKQVGSYEPPDK